MLPANQACIEANKIKLEEEQNKKSGSSSGGSVSGGGHYEMSKLIVGMELKNCLQAVWKRGAILACVM